MILKHGGWSCCQVKLSHSRVVTTINSTLGQDFLIINIKLNILICSHSWQNHADHHSKVDTHLTDIIMDATTSLADDLQDLQLDRVDNKLKVYINWIVITKNLQNISLMTKAFLECKTDMCWACHSRNLTHTLTFVENYSQYKHTTFCKNFKFCSMSLV